MGIVRDDAIDSSFFLYFFSFLAYYHHPVRAQAPKSFNYTSYRTYHICRNRNNRNIDRCSLGASRRIARETIRLHTAEMMLSEKVENAMRILKRKGINVLSSSFTPTQHRPMPLAVASHKRNTLRIVWQLRRQQYRIAIGITHSICSRI